MRVFGSLFVFAAIALGAAVPAHAQDAEAGMKVFKSQCSICHSSLAGKNMIGPTMAGVVGRQSGQIEGFHYSAANLAAHLTWDEATLNKYLADPKQVVPGTIMTYAGLKDDKQRANLIAYLVTLK